MHIGTWGSMFTNPGHGVIYWLFTSNLRGWGTFLSWIQVTQSWIDWFLPVIIPFILFAYLLWWESLLLLSKSAKLVVNFGPTAFFYSLILTMIPQSSLITKHPKFCRWESSWCVFAVMWRPPVHAFFMSQLGLSLIICASTCHLPARFSFQEETSSGLVLSVHSLLTPAEGNSLQQGGCLDLACHFDRVCIFQDTSLGCCPSLAFELGMWYLCQDRFSYFSFDSVQFSSVAQSQDACFFKTWFLFWPSSTFLDKTFKLAYFVRLSYTQF